MISHYDSLSACASGAVFGAALTAAGVWMPSVIISQLRLESFQMLKSFLMASASSSVIFYLFENAGWFRCSPRKPSNLGWIARYDGNVIGGLLLGAGMSLTGACPGTVLAQVAAGVPSAKFALLGGAIGGIVYAGTSKYLRNEAKHSQGESQHVYTSLKISYGGTLLAYEGLIAIALTLASRLDQASAGPLSPILGGVCIGGAQMASLIVARSPLGVSTAYENIGKWFWRGLDVLRGKKERLELPPSATSLMFGAGIMAGSWVLIRTRPEFGVLADTQSISPARAVLGGIAMVTGARIAGGCTSGHGITGMSLFCISSVLTVISMFAGGIGLSAII